MEEPTKTRANWGSVLGGAAIMQLPLKWIWRAVEELGNIDLLVTRANDPDWMGGLLRMLADVFHEPEVVVFIIGVLWLAYLHRKSSLVLAPILKQGSFPSPVSPQNAASREKIIVLSRVYAQPAYAAAQQVTDRLWDRLHISEEVKDQTIALLVKRYPFFRCGHAYSVLRSTLDDGPDKDNFELLEKQLREFFNGYQDLVEWTSCLVQVYSFPLSEAPDYKVWQENHRVFYQELRRLIAADDFFGLRRSLPEQWVDLPR